MIFTRVDDTNSTTIVREFNGEGNLDLATANGSSNDVSVLLGKGIRIITQFQIINLSSN
ncbi:MAG: hypothetical protein F6K48_06625 [Okeania sp. SIO3H1]|uniref:hypothetical protein n=1 Tax=Okeania sp. SIO1I7 TaxID=2607772 RepID=UPI0013C76176|nr:hypothetical protein [Okeania sp. SIO1I7]NEN88609.1 hypothetical protein [Okeania sp. SIO3H1]NET26410.1 hypothetical protein [Okeania sp. SIO1I7]